MVSMSNHKHNICLIKKTSCHKHFRPTSTQLWPETTTKLSVILCTKTFLFLGSGWNIQRWWRVSHQRCAEVGFFKMKINSHMKNPASPEILGYISKSHLPLADTDGFWTKNWSDYEMFIPREPKVLFNVQTLENRADFTLLFQPQSMRWFHWP